MTSAERRVKRLARNEVRPNNDRVLLAENFISKIEREFLEFRTKRGNFHFVINRINLILASFRSPELTGFQVLRVANYDAAMRNYRLISRVTNTPLDYPLDTIQPGRLLADQVRRRRTVPAKIKFKNRRAKFIVQRVKTIQTNLVNDTVLSVRVAISMDLHSRVIQHTF